MLRKISKQFTRNFTSWVPKSIVNEQIIKPNEYLNMYYNIKFENDDIIFNDKWTVCDESKKKLTYDKGSPVAVFSEYGMLRNRINNNGQLSYLFPKCGTHNHDISTFLKICDYALFTHDKNKRLIYQNLPFMNNLKNIFIFSKNELNDWDDYYKEYFSKNDTLLKKRPIAIIFSLEGGNIGDNDTMNDIGHSKISDLSFNRIFESQEYKINFNHKKGYYVNLLEPYINMIQVAKMLGLKELNIYEDTKERVNKRLSK